LCCSARPKKQETLKMTSNLISETAACESISSPNHREPIAIIGVACRLPSAPDVQSFWNLLVEGRDGVLDEAPARLNLADLYDPIPGKPGRVPSRAGGFLDKVEQFDATFFDISPAVAMRMDPQHRLLLENTWDALRDAGLTAAELAGSRTGVYTACFVSEYWDLLRRAGIRDLYAAVGAGPWEVPAGRISYQLDLRGPSMGLDTNCSASLLGVHLACQSIWSGESEAAIVGGVNVLVAPDMHLALAEAGVLSPSGRCRFGDESADGYVRSEGVVTIILKPLHRARADGNRVYATIIGSAVSNDGRCGESPVAPGQQAQEEMLRAAYQHAGIAPSMVRYVEAHGASAGLGDPRELRALRAVLGAGRDPGDQCLVGSVKSNIGHTETTAGLAGLLKTCLAIQHKLIPRTLHVQAPAAVVSGVDTPIALATTASPWPGDGPAIAGVSSFGLAGTNVHVVLSEVEPVEQPARLDRDRPYLLPISARDPEALGVLAGRYADLLAAERVNILDLCYSAGARTTQHEHRLAVRGNDRWALVEGLRAAASGDRPAVSGIAGAAPRVVFVFPGQGSHWTGMGRTLLEQCGTFAARFRECSAAIEEELGWSVERALRAGDHLSIMDQMQPAVWAVQVALAEVWRSWGIEPDLVLGHSTGEVAGAVVAGALSVREGAAIICRRARLLMELPDLGAMWAVQLSAEEAEAAIGDLADQVCVAVINSEYSTVLAGDEVALEKVVAPLIERGVFCRPVRAGFASHSPHVEPLREQFVAALAELRPQPGRYPIHSTVVDRIVDGTELDGEYWMRNLRAPVRFLDGVRAAIADGRETLFIEISPHPILRPALADTLDLAGAKAWVAHSLRRDEPELGELLTNLGVAYAHGCEPAWDRVYRRARFVPTPSYPWQRKRFWIDLPEGPPVSAAVVPVAIPAFEPEPARKPVSSLEAITQRLTQRTAEILALPPEQLDPHLPLVRSGLDSLLATKLHAQLKHELDLHIPIRDFLSSATLHELALQAHARKDQGS
jgi:acyl transferase domain-containing protein